MNRLPLIRYGLRWGLVNAVVACLFLLMPAQAQSQTTIVALGDSLTAGLGLARGDAFPARLEAALRADGLDVRVVNAGVSGDTSAGGRARLGWTLASGPVDAVVLELGANDGLRGIDPQSTKANLSAMLSALAAKKIPVLLTGMLAPPNLGPEYGRDFNAVFKQLADDHAVPFYPFFLEGVAAMPQFNQKDGIHPNAVGVGMIVERIAPFVKKLIAAK